MEKLTFLPDLTSLVIACTALLGVLFPFIHEFWRKKQELQKIRYEAYYQQLSIAFGRFAEAYGKYRGSRVLEYRSIFFSALTYATLFSDLLTRQALTRLKDSFDITGGFIDTAASDALYEECITLMSSLLDNAKSDIKRNR